MRQQYAPNVACTGVGVFVGIEQDRGPAVSPDGYGLQLGAVKTGAAHGQLELLDHLGDWKWGTVTDTVMLSQQLGQLVALFVGFAGGCGCVAQGRGQRVELLQCLWVGWLLAQFGQELLFLFCSEVQGGKHAGRGQQAVGVQVVVIGAVGQFPILAWALSLLELAQFCGIKPSDDADLSLCFAVVSVAPCVLRLLCAGVGGVAQALVDLFAELFQHLHKYDAGHAQGGGMPSGHSCMSLPWR